MKTASQLGALAVALLLSACAVAPPMQDPKPPLPAQWLAPLPHGGQAASLVDWWQAFGDAQLLALQAQAQQRNPQLAQALARLSQARAQREAAGALLAPQLNAQASAQRAKTLPSFQAMGSGVAQLQASWEMDLFGAQRAQAQAGQALAEAAQAQWHEARVSLAAEVAQAYLSYRQAQIAAGLAAQDLEAAERIERAAAQAAERGLLAPAQAAEARVQLSEAQVMAATQRALPGLWLQSLALLVADDAAALAQRLGEAALPQAPQFPVPGVPATVLAQRPDLRSAHQQWLAAVFEQHSAEAQRYPQLSWGALLGEGRLRMDGQTLKGGIWSIAPSLNLPLFDGGLRKAQSAAAAAREQEARAALEARWRQAVAEVEEALLTVQKSETQVAAVQAAIAQWQRLDAVAEQRARAGLISGLERAQAARQFIAAKQGAYELALARSNAWIALYRRLGGGWSQEQDS